MSDEGKNKNYKKKTKKNTKNEIPMRDKMFCNKTKSGMNSYVRIQKQIMCSVFTFVQCKRTLLLQAVHAAFECVTNISFPLSLQSTVLFIINAVRYASKMRYTKTAYFTIIANLKPVIPSYHIYTTTNKTPTTLAYKLVET